jgi:hypothetical protein
MSEERRKQECPIPPPEEIAEAGLRVPTVRLSPNNETVLAELGLLADLAGTWQAAGSTSSLALISKATPTSTFKSTPPMKCLR